MANETTSCLAVTGKDRETFLQGQLTQDIRRLSAGEAPLAAWCTPKGRVVALLRLIGERDCILIFLPAWQAETFREAILRYRLRADVQIEEAPGMTVRALRGDGNDVPGALAVAPLPSNAGQAALVFTASTNADDGRPGQLDAGERELAEIRAGIPALAPATVGEFTPHMMNLDLLGAVSFAKGCYTGQEVVARTENLGRPSRRMLAFAVESDSPPAPGERVLDENGTAVASVLRAARSPDGVDLLAVVSLKSLGGGLRLADGAQLRQEPLPYSVPELSAV